MADSGPSKGTRKSWRMLAAWVALAKAASKGAGSMGLLKVQTWASLRDSADPWGLR